MEKLFEKQEALFKIEEQIENDLLKLTGFYFPTPHMLYFMAVDNKITSDDFNKAFNLMFEYRRVKNAIYAIDAELEEIRKELKR